MSPIFGGLHGHEGHREHDTDHDDNESGTVSRNNSPRLFAELDAIRQSLREIQHMTEQLAEAQSNLDSTIQKVATDVQTLLDQIAAGADTATAVAALEASTAALTDIDTKVLSGVTPPPVTDPGSDPVVG